MKPNEHQPCVPNWSYEDVETKVWSIPKLSDFWGIGSRTEKRLHKLGITSIKKLANSNPDLLKKEFGKVGVQLWFHANGVDESNVHQPYKPKSHGLGTLRCYLVTTLSSVILRLS